MPLQIIRDDITRVRCDAIVNAANCSLLGGGGVDGAIHRAAGPELLKECRTLGGCATGQAKITKGYRLPCRYVIHTPGPIWRGGTHGEPELLASCYEQSLILARDHGCETVAFPLISAGVYGYPKAEAVRIAADTISRFLSEEAPDMTVFLVVFDKGSFLISEELYKDIRSFVDDNYVEELQKDPELFGERRLNSQSLPFPASAPCPAEGAAPKAEKTSRRQSGGFFGKRMSRREKSSPAESMIAPCEEEAVFEDLSAAAPSVSRSLSLEQMLGSIDESFSEMLMRKIDERNMKDSECYKKANIDRKLFSKIRSDRLYKPSKSTVLAFAIALELSLDETADMLQKAGFALSNSSKSDIIIRYFIINGIYDIFTINETLFSFDQKLLGA